VVAQRFLVRGRVQGVGYRYFVLRQAQLLGVSGHARNLPDSSVEVVAEGPQAALDDLEALLRQGPAFAQVESVERNPITPQGAAGFRIF